MQQPPDERRRLAAPQRRAGELVAEQVGDQLHRHGRRRGAGGAAGHGRHRQAGARGRDRDDAPARPRRAARARGGGGHGLGAAAARVVGGVAEWLAAGPREADRAAQPLRRRGEQRTGAVAPDGEVHEVGHGTRGDGGDGGAVGAWAWVGAHEAVVRCGRVQPRPPRGAPAARRPARRPVASR